MKSFWNDLSLETRIEGSRIAKELFKNNVIRAFLEHGEGPFSPTNKELAEICRLPEHAVKRYLNHWKKLGVFTTSSKRHYHHSFGWCNKRTIDVHPTYVAAVSALIRSGKVL